MRGSFHHTIRSSRPNDGSDCPPTSASQGPRKAVSSQLINFGLFRIQIGIPSTANFSLASASNPERCAVAPGSSGAGGQLFMFRRPLPSTNLIFDSAIMWDGRETLQKITTAAGFQAEAPWLFDLNDQANSATTGHAQGAAIAGTPALADIVAFETNLYTVQSRLLFQPLDVKGAKGGAQYITDVLRHRPAGRPDRRSGGLPECAIEVKSRWRASRIESHGHHLAWEARTIMPP